MPRRTYDYRKGRARPQSGNGRDFDWLVAQLRLDADRRRAIRPDHTPRRPR